MTDLKKFKKSAIIIFFATFFLSGACYANEKLVTVFNPPQPNYANYSELKPVTLTEDRALLEKIKRLLDETKDFANCDCEGEQIKVQPPGPDEVILIEYVSLNPNNPRYHFIIEKGKRKRAEEERKRAEECGSVKL
jgi:hypothetical protein